MSSRQRSRIDVTDVSHLKGKIVGRIIEDTGAGRTTYYISFSDGTLIGWSYTIGHTFIRRPGEPIRDVY